MEVGVGVDVDESVEVCVGVEEGGGGTSVDEGVVVGVPVGKEVGVAVPVQVGVRVDVGRINPSHSSAPISKAEP